MGMDKHVDKHVGNKGMDKHVDNMGMDKHAMVIVYFETDQVDVGVKKQLSEMQWIFYIYSDILLL